FSQRDVRTTGVPAVTSPFGFTVPDQDEAQSGPLHKDSFSSTSNAPSQPIERAVLRLNRSDVHGAVRLGRNEDQPVTIVFGGNEAILWCCCSGCHSAGMSSAEL